MIEKDQYIFGIRAVIEAIQSGKEIDKLLIKKDINGELINELFALIKERHLVVQRVPVEKINRITRKNHQGVVAFLSAVTYYNIEEVVPVLFEEGINPFLIVLDGITDVRNFGAIARTCDCAGVNAIIIPERNSVSVNADAIKTSAGALNYVPVCREKNLVNVVKFLKSSGYKVVGASEKSSVNYTKVDYTGPVALILGAEDKGISNDLLKLCDEFVSIPEFGNINSLNVSVRLTLTIKLSCRATDWQKMRWLSASLMKPPGLWLTKWIATSSNIRAKPSRRVLKHAPYRLSSTAAKRCRNMVLKSAMKQVCRSRNVW